MRIVTLAAALTVLGCNATTKKDTAMNNVQQKILQSVHTDLQWKTDEVRVDEVSSLRRGSCSFYTAAHTARPIAFQPNYAVLGDDVVGVSDASVARILSACGADAPASWQADIITRFHPALGSGVVLQSESQHHGAIRKVKAAGVTFAPPTLTGSTLSYYLLEPELFAVFAVKATRAADGTCSVEKTELQPP